MSFVGGSYRWHPITLVLPLEYPLGQKPLPLLSIGIFVPHLFGWVQTAADAAQKRDQPKPGYQSRLRR